MIKLTGYRPKEAWYVVYGPAWTNLGGLSGGTMLIDLAHGSHSSGAIGYYIGYRIVEQYVQKVGPNAWKDVFTRSPKEIYRLSGY